MAIRVWNLLCDGNGGLDFSGLPLVVEWLGVTDVDGLLHRLAVIKTHDPRRPASE